MQQQEQIRESWDQIAEGFDRFTTDINIALGEEALRTVALRSGERFLDVAAGTGALSIPAARLGAQVVATDISPAMVEHLAARARQEGLSHLEGRVMDGEALELPDDTFDVAGSQFGVMLFGDLPRGLAEMVRVTKPGGRVVVIAFGSPMKAEFLGFFIGAMKAVVPDFTGLPMDPPPLPFQVADPQVLSRRMAEAALQDVRVETVDHTMPFPSGRALYDTVTNSNPIGRAFVAPLTDEQKLEVQEVLDRMLRERSAAGPAVLHNEVNIAVGTK